MAHDDLMTAQGLIWHLSAADVAMTLTNDGQIELTGTPPSGTLISVLRINKGAVVTFLSLERRLTRGWAVCEEEPDPARRSRLEDHWIALLHEYEDACDAPLLKEVA